jgi:Big-like domain-containing protein
MLMRGVNLFVLICLSTLMAVATASAQAPAVPSCGKKPEVSGFLGQIAIATQQKYPLSNTTTIYKDRSLMIWDLTNQGSAPLDTRWYQGSLPWPTQPYSHPQWDVGTLGDVFGLTLDHIGNIYVAATRIYGSNYSGLPATGLVPARAGRIYKIDAVTGVPVLFAQLGNDNNGLGNLDYSRLHNSLYVSNFWDGLITRIDMTGMPKGSWDHGLNLPSAVPPRPAIVGSDGSSSYAALGRRPWAVRVYQNRLYYSIWNEHWWRGGQRPGNFRNEIWSVGLDGQGDPIGPARLEIQLPIYSATNPYTNPVAGMSFGPTGKLLLAERTMSSNNSTDAHQSRLLEYSWNGAAWVPSPNTYEVGRIPLFGTPTNSAGGVDVEQSLSGRVWNTGDALHFVGYLGSPDTEYIYGLQGFPQSGGNLLNSILIDLNDDVLNANKLQLGDVRIPCPATGVLKVCKVAGPGVAVGTPFTFTAGSSTFTVPAGPPPGGTCVVGPSFPVGSVVTVAETIPLGDTVSSITVAPPGQLNGVPNLTAGTVNLTIAAGVTEVTYTDKRTGYLEICKRTGEPAVSGNFTFYVNGTLGPFVVPVGACTPAIEVPAGLTTINEVPTTAGSMVGCNTIPAGQQISCTPPTSTVTVDPGDVSQQTIAFITNRRGRVIEPERGRTSTAVSCAPSPAPVGGAVRCIAKVTSVSSGSAMPTGTVKFTDGKVELGAVPLGPDGTASLTTSALVVGDHAIVGAYSGDSALNPSVSDPFVETVGAR